MSNKKSLPWFTHKTRNILGALLLVLTVVFAGTFVWHQRQPSVERAAQEIAVVFASLDYRDQDGWAAKVKEVSNAAGWSFWSYTMEHGMWDDAVAKEVVTTKVRARSAEILETLDNGAVHVQVTVHAEGYSESKPFSKDYDYQFLMSNEDGSWLFQGFLPAERAK